MEGKRAGRGHIEKRSRRAGPQSALSAGKQVLGAITGYNRITCLRTIIGLWVISVDYWLVIIDSTLSSARSDGLKSHQGTL